MNKKTGLIIFIAILVSTFAISLVSAQYGGGLDLRRGSEQLINLVVDFAEPFLQVLLGGESGGWSGYLLFEKLVLFLIIASIVFFSLDKSSIFEDNKGVRWIITLAIPLIAVRWINFEWLDYIILQYQVLGIFITVLLPFVIYLFFLHGVSHSSSFRRIGWLLYIGIYYGLWTTSSAAGLVGNAYVWSIVVAILLMIFDPAIHRVMTRREELEPLRANINNSIAELDQQLRNLQYAPHIRESEKEKMKKFLEKKIARLHKELAKL